MIYGSPYPIYSYLHHEISLRALRHCLFITYGEKCYARMAEILSPLIVARDTTTHPPPRFPTLFLTLFGFHVPAIRSAQQIKYYVNSAGRVRHPVTIPVLRS